MAKKKDFTVEYVEKRYMLKWGDIRAVDIEEARELAEEKYSFEERGDGLGNGFGSKVIKVWEDEE